MSYDWYQSCHQGKGICWCRVNIGSSKLLVPWGIKATSKFKISKNIISRLDNYLWKVNVYETWCTDKSSVSLGLIQPPGYSVIHLPRQDRRGGGVGLLYCDSYKAKRVKVEKLSSFEHQTVSLSCGTEQLLVTCVYLNSGVFTQDFSSQFSELISFLQTKRAKHLIVGDFNFHSNIDTDADAKKLKSLLNSSILFNMWIYPRTLLGIHWI